MNLIIVTGRLGKDPELRTTNGDRTVANFSIAVKEYGQKKDDPLWLNVVVWDKLAEIVKEYGAKGKEATVYGRLQIRKYESQSETKTSIEIVANAVEFASTAGRESGSGDRPAQTRSSKPSGNRTSRRDEPEIDDSDVPF